MRTLLFTTFLLLSGLFFIPAHASNDQYIVDRLQSNGLTKYDNVEQFRPERHITRGEASKFIVEFAKVLGKAKVKDKQDCKFNDISDYDQTLLPYVIESCEYGIFNGSNGNFFPNNSITKGEAIAIVMRNVYGKLDEINYFPWYNAYLEKAIKLGFENIENIDLIKNNFDQPITRIQIASRVYQLYQVKSTVLGIRDGNQDIFQLDSAYAVLDGKGLDCEELTTKEYHLKPSYECNDPTNYPAIKSFLNNLETVKYQEAADIMNKNSMIPLIRSSINIPVYFVPFHKGILGFFISGNGGASYNMLYITVNNEKLHLYRSKKFLSVGTDHSIFWQTLDEFYPEPPYPSAYFPKGFKECNFDQECINTHLKEVMLGTSDDQKTISWVDAMKQKILKYQQ